MTLLSTRFTGRLREINNSKTIDQWLNFQTSTQNTSKPWTIIFSDNGIPYASTASTAHSNNPIKWCNGVYSGMEVKLEYTPGTNNLLAKETVAISVIGY